MVIQIFPQHLFNTVQHQTDETSVNHRSNHDEIPRRPYEIYLERGGLPGNELDDWFRARTRTPRGRSVHMKLESSSTAALPGYEDGN
jgi:Protein of unknown function (DUF2934)